MKVLVLGGGGQVGRAMAMRCPPGHEVYAPPRAQADIADKSKLEALVDGQQFDCVVNAAAYTAVDLAEDEQLKAAAVNAEAVRDISAIAGRARVRLLHLSTDFVFDGRASVAYLPTSAANPLGVYGRTKLTGEAYALATPDNIVVRTSWVYASYGRNFVLTMLRLMRERDEVRVVRDQVGSPTWAGGLATAIWTLLLNRASGGVYQWSDDGIASWYDFAVAIQEEALSRKLLPRSKLILPIRTADYPTRAVRPAFSVLNCDSTHAATRLPPTHWRENLRNMLDELQSA